MTAIPSPSSPNCDWFNRDDESNIFPNSSVHYDSPPTTNFNGPTNSPTLSLIYQSGSSGCAGAPLLLTLHVRPSPDLLISSFRIIFTAPSEPGDLFGSSARPYATLTRVLGEADLTDRARLAEVQLMAIIPSSDLVLGDAARNSSSGGLVVNMAVQAVDHARNIAAHLDLGEFAYKDSASRGLDDPRTVPAPATSQIVSPTTRTSHSRASPSASEKETSFHMKTLDDLLEEALLPEDQRTVNSPSHAHITYIPDEPARSSSSPSQHYGQTYKRGHSEASDATNVSTPPSDKETPAQKPFELTFAGDIDAFTSEWNYEEKRNHRRLVEFTRSQTAHVIQLRGRSIPQTDFMIDDDSTANKVTISCIYWPEQNQYLYTSADLLDLLQFAVGGRLTSDEKNRLRRNWEAFKPQTISKTRKDEQSFFNTLMKFPPPRPRKIEKDVKVYRWSTLSAALSKVIHMCAVNLKPANTPGKDDLSPTAIAAGSAEASSHSKRPKISLAPAAVRNAKKKTQVTVNPMQSRDTGNAAVTDVPGDGLPEQAARSRTHQRGDSSSHNPSSSSYSYYQATPQNTSQTGMWNLPAAGQSALSDDPIRTSFAADVRQQPSQSVSDRVDGILAAQAAATYSAMSESQYQPPSARGDGLFPPGQMQPFTAGPSSAVSGVFDNSSTTLPAPSVSATESASGSGESVSSTTPLSAMYSAYQTGPVAPSFDGQPTAHQQQPTMSSSYISSTGTPIPVSAFGTPQFATYLGNPFGRGASETDPYALYAYNTGQSDSRSQQYQQHAPQNPPQQQFQQPQHSQPAQPQYPQYQPQQQNRPPPNHEQPAVPHAQQFSQYAFYNQSARFS